MLLNKPSPFKQTRHHLRAGAVPFAACCVAAGLARAPGPAFTLDHRDAVVEALTAPGF